MHYRVLQEAIRRRPFQPFFIAMSSGERYLVAHPENMTLTKDSVVVPIYARNRHADVADHAVWASYLHIAALEPVLSSSKTKK